MPSILSLRVKPCRLMDHVGDLSRRRAVQYRLRYGCRIQFDNTSISLIRISVDVGLLTSIYFAIAFGKSQSA